MDIIPLATPAAASAASSAAAGNPVSDSAADLCPLPSTPQATLARSSSLTPVVVDQRAIGRLLATLLARAGLSVGEASRQLGISSATLRQYLHGRRGKPSLIWFVRLVDLCGAKLKLEFPR